MTNEALQFRLAQFVCVCSSLFLVICVVWALSSFAWALLTIVFPIIRNVIAYGFLVFLPLAIHANRCSWLRLKAQHDLKTKRVVVASYFYTQCVLIRWSWFCGTGVGGALIFALFDYESRGTSHEAAQPYLVIGLILAILGTAMSSDTTQRYAYNPDDEEPTKQITPLSFELKWRIGARTAAFLVSALTKYSSKIELLGHGDNWGDAKRALDWMLLGELEAGSQIQLRVDGADASAAIERITQIFTGGTRQACCPHPECTSTPSLIECAGDMYLYACSNGHSW